MNGQICTGDVIEDAVKRASGAFRFPVVEVEVGEMWRGSVPLENKIHDLLLSNIDMIFKLSRWRSHMSAKPGC